MKKGYLTVYLSLTLAILFSFVLALAYGAGTSAARMRAVCVADIGINSTLSEYNRELFEQYDLLFVDMSYGSEGGNIGTLQSHLEYYLKENLDYAISYPARDLLGMKLGSTGIEEYALATDGAGEAVRRQVADYMRTTLKGLIIDPIDEVTGNLLNSGFEYDVEGMQNTNQSVLDHMGNPVGKDDDGNDIEIPVNNPADVVNGMRGGGILGIVLNDTSKISRTKTDVSQYASNRTLNRGNGISEEEKKIGREAGRLTYCEYLFDKCGYYEHLKEGSLLDYEIEYIIKGHGNDWDNLESVCKTLTLWREGINFLFLMQDEVRKNEARELALTLAAVILNPELEEPITISILLAWAFVEALQDVKILLEGGGVPIAKTNETWHTVLSDILHPISALKSYPNQEGAKYGDYLKSMLLLTGFAKVMIKSLDVMEMDVRKASGDDSFRMDECVHSFKVDIVIMDKYKHKNEILRRNGYFYA